METKFMRRRGGKTHYAVLQALSTPHDITFLTFSVGAVRNAMEEACRILNTTDIAYEINRAESKIAFNGKTVTFTLFARHFGSISHPLNPPPLNQPLIIDEVLLCLDSLNKVKLVTGTIYGEEGVSNGCNN